MANWLVKTEPSSYSYDDLERDGQTVWDGVRNAQALIHLRAMRPGDRVLVYHSGDERAIVGSAMVAGAPYVDPQHDDPKMTVVDIKSDRRAKRHVPLREIKQEPAFQSMALVRQPRLSVMPVTDDQWSRLEELAGLA
jgi:predicted RNA-binding protein with PUA-like domain